MQIRTYQPGDEASQVAIYNTAAAALPKFMPATADDIRRRYQADDFDPGSRFFAEEGGRLVGYTGFHASGRVSYPWCLPGFEGAALPLFEHVLAEMRRRGLSPALAAYRGDWPAQLAFFQQHGFHRTREMINFVRPLHEMPTRILKKRFTFAPPQPEDIPAIRALAPQVLRVKTDQELARHLLQNPYFPPSDVFVLRTAKEGGIVAAGLFIQNPAYADPRAVDAAMPCFRLGAFGTEGLQTKRLNGLFSFLARDDVHLPAFANALLDHATAQVLRPEGAALAAQVASDVPHLLKFYQQGFHRQGSFPILERML